jgi:transposase
LFPAAESGHHVDAAASVAGGSGQYCQGGEAGVPEGVAGDAGPDELGAWYQDEAFRVTYGTRGAPGVSPAQLAMITVLQFTENLTDRQAADAVRGRLDWKYCLGLELDDEGFDFSVLSEFRSRLVAGAMEAALLDALLARLGALGLVGAGMRQRTDSTHVLGRIRDLNRLELAGETVRAALEALAACRAGLAGPGDRRVLAGGLRAADR